MALSFSGFSSESALIHAAARTWFACLLGPLIVCIGCQTARPEAMASQRAFIDFTGLAPLMNISALKASGSVPDDWTPLPLLQTPLYAHEQWRSPTLTTGVGIACIHLPLPVPAAAVLWFAQREYTAKSDDGQSLGRWTDAQGRQWFAAQNKRFYVRGYVVTRGIDAWIVYCGYRRLNAPRPDELSLAVRSMETIVPGGNIGSDTGSAPHLTVASANGQ
jgi:hypothetical protein